MASTKQLVYKISTFVLAVTWLIAGCNKIMALYFPSTDLFDAVNSYIRALKPFTSNELAPYITMMMNASIEIVASVLIIYGKHHAGTVGNLMIVFVLLNTIGMILTSGLPEEQSEWILLSITFITAIGRLLTMSAAKETKETKVN